MKRFKGRFTMDAASVAAISSDVAAMAKRALASNGFLKTPARISRTGIQEYSKLELGLDASNDIVRMYRSPEEVFSPDTLASFDGATVTFLHPEGGVDSGNWRQVACGDCHNAAQDADDSSFTRADLIVRDADAIQAIAWGIKEISCGYDFEIDMTPGTTPDGKAYDGLQKKIVGDHVAFVPAGRCGAGCAIGDCACQAGDHPASHQHRKDTVMRKILLNGISLSLEDQAADIVDAFVSEKAKEIGSLTKRATDAEGALTAQGEAMKTAATSHRAALDAAEAKILKPEQVKVMVAELATVAADAKRFSPEFVTDGKTAVEIRIGILDEVLAGEGDGKTLLGKMLGSSEPAKAPEVLVRAAFDAIISIGAPTSDGGDGYQQEVARAMAGTGAASPTVARDAKGNAKLSGRQLMIARGRAPAPAAQ